MDPKDVKKLRRLANFEALVDYLRDELDWPIKVEAADDLTFDYDPAELGIDPKHAVKIESIKQIRPLADQQPWGIFYVQFESKRLPVVVLRRVLRALVPKSRRRDPHQPVWRMSDLLFISAQGETDYRSISFAHFRQREGRVAKLRTFSWDSRETHFYYIKNLNLEALRWPQDELDAAAWRNRWRSAFRIEHRYTITTSKILAQEMARHAATVRDLVGEVYGLEANDGPLHQLYNSFKELLLHDLTPKTFADMVAQTVAYGLFSAATQTDDLTFDRVVELIPNTNPFLRDLLTELTTQGAVDGSTKLTIDLEELGVSQLVELLRQTDVAAILHDFGRQTGGGREDPVIHFYELFLSEYDKRQKVRRGVFYTPDPVVSYIVRSVDYLLKSEFGLADGLADTSIDPETGEPLVQILDPATGTGTFLAHVIDQIEKTVKARPGVDWNAYIAEHLLPRLHGLELMMAPYAVAHMKLGLKLRQTGYDFSSDERLRIYLTNALEEPVEMQETLALSGFLSQEANQAARVKRHTPITVVIGNPPYAGHSANDSAWIAGLLRGLDDQGRAVENYFEVDGHGLNERNPKWLNDDYVKFIRFGQWRIQQTGAGILAFITNHGYLDNPTFRGMRQSLMADFDAIYVLDLHGSLVKKETAPDGSPDENVFDIQPGVAILLAIKRPQTAKAPKTLQVYHADLKGSREQKYTRLINTDASSTLWEELLPSIPFHLFVPQDVLVRAEYMQGWPVSKIMSVNSVGIVTARDHFTIHWSPNEFWRVLQDFAALPTEKARERYNLRQDVHDWKVRLAQKDILVGGPDYNKVVPILYRTFDTRYTYYTGQTRGFLCRPRPEVMHHMLAGKNLGLVTTRQQSQKSGWKLVGIANTIIEGCYISNKTREINYLYPLYLYPNPAAATLFDLQEPTDAPGGRRPNLSPDFIADLSKRLDLRFIPDGRGDLSQTFGPEDILHYAYAVFHSPTYRTRYAEFLKIDFPRLPLTSERELFAALVGLGADLVALHLLEDDYPAASWNLQGANSPLQSPITTFVERETGSKVGKFARRSCYHQGCVYLDTSQRAHSSYFEGVPEDVWKFHVGGYQVLYKWLYDRRETGSQAGRVLTAEDIAHYQRVVVALKETMRLMEEIDEVIDTHGGWPIE